MKMIVDSEQKDTNQAGKVGTEGATVKNEQETAKNVAENNNSSP